MWQRLWLVLTGLAAAFILATVTISKQPGVGIYAMLIAVLMWVAEGEHGE